MFLWARERSGVPLDALIKRFPKYLSWEKGEASPTLKQLEALSKKTATPLGYLFLPSPPEESLPVPDFRTMADGGVRRPSPDLLETIQTMQRRQGWMRDYLVEEGAEPLPYIGTCTVNDGFQAVATNIRETLNLELHWAQRHRTWESALRALRKAVERVGILVFANGVAGNNNRRKLDPREFRGFVLCDTLAPLIFVNNADAKSARMFTLAHELAHLWLGKGAVFNLEALQPADDATEKFCNRVAAEFLIPAEQLHAIWAEAETQDDPFQMIARHFKVSSIVAARRALDLGLVPRNAFFDFYQSRMQKAWGKQTGKSGGDYYATQGSRIDSRFAKAIVRSVKEGHLLYTHAYRLIGMQGKTFDRFAKTLNPGMQP